MNTEQKREAIRLKVVEVIPEILELKFGCEIKSKDYNSIHIILNVITEYPDVAEVIQKGYDLSTTQFVKVERDFEIIGRPINALDILRALSFFVEEGEGLSVWLTHDGILELSSGVGLPINKNLSEWSPESIDELYKLMCE